MRAFTLLIVAALAAAAVSQDTDLNISEKVFEAEFHKLYGDKEAETEAAAALAAAEKQINAHNELFKEGKSSYFEKLNVDSDMPKDLFEKEKEGELLPQMRFGLGAILPPEEEWYTHPHLEEFYRDRQTPPASYDATALGMVTPARNQLSCGSCAAFAATGAHETCMLVAGARDRFYEAAFRYNGLDLSEQYIIDCGYNGQGMNGCKGAYSDQYGEVFSSRLGGQGPHEVTYPYLNTDPKLACPSDQAVYNSGAFVEKTMGDYGCDENKLMSLVSSFGAAVSYIYASDAGFYNYAGGVFDGCTSKTIDHAVLVVGYGTDAASGKNYWLVKNSWGPSWGSNGLIKIFRGNSQCGIGAFCYVAKCGPTNGTLSDPPVEPPPPPTPLSLTCDLSHYWPTLTGDYILNFNNTETYVTCTNGICRPTRAGPSNACMYICGKLSC